MSENDKHNRAFDSDNGPTPPDRASENAGFQHAPDEPVSAELLSAYLDNPDELEPETRRRVEQELATNAEARQTLHELQAIVQGLQSLPEVSAPRSYHLTAEMVGAPEPVRMQETSAWYVRHTETIRWATAAAAILFVFVFTADLVTNGVGSGDRVADRNSFTTESGDTADEPSTLRAADDADSGGDASGAAEADLQPVAGDDAASDGGAEITATSAPVETQGEVAEAEEDAPEEESGGGTDAVESPDQDTAQDEAAPTPAAEGGQAEDGAAEEAEENPVTLDAPEEAATEAQAEPVPDRDGGESNDDADTAADTGTTEEQPETMALAEEADEGGSDSRTVWRAVEFSLILILALLLTVMIILPRLDRRPVESRGRRR